MEDKILDILTEICDDEIVKKDKNINLFETELLDSLGFVEFLYAIEKNFGLLLAPTQIKCEEFKTPNQIISIIKERIKQ